MRYLTLTLALLSTCLFSKEPKFELSPSLPEQIGTFSQVDEFLIGGVVSPMSGQVCLQRTDLEAKGAENVRLHRIYVGTTFPSFQTAKGELENYLKERFYFKELQKNLKGWIFLPQLYLEHIGFTVHLPTPEGTVYDFYLQNLASLYGVSNVSGGRPSGSYDPRNIKIQHETNQKIVHFPNGIKRIYNSYPKYLGLFRLEKEILANGRIIKYLYRDDSQIKRIESCDPTEQFVYASVELDGNSHDQVLSYKDKWENGPFGNFQGKNGEEVLDTHGFPYYELLLANSSCGKATMFSYDLPVINKKILKNTLKAKCIYHISLPLSLKTASSPVYREETTTYDSFRLKRYSDEKHNFECAYSASGRVETLSFPVGDKEEMIPVYRLSYDLPVAGVRSGSTTVKRCDGLETIYHFSKDFLLEKIQWYSSDEKLLKEKNFTYDTNHRLESIEIQDGQKVLQTRTYGEYDAFGNAQLETFEGITIRKKYSDDGRNLLLKEEHEDGKTLNFSYLPNTNLLKNRFTCEKEKISFSEIYEYDSYNNLISKTITDGKNQHTITRYTLRQSEPFLHMPEIVEEFYVKDSKEILLEKRKIEYDNWGNPCKESVYDANGQLAYTTTKTFDEQGNILSETNPLGYTKTTTYDLKGNPKLTFNFSGNLKKEMTYDSLNHLKKIEETGPALHTTNYTYDSCGRCKTSTDYLGTVSTFEYDPLSAQITKTTRVSPHGDSIEFSFSYDALGRKLTETDPNGHTTTYTYNSYGSPEQIFYPTDATETFTYYANGWLKTRTDRNQLVTEYKYDILGRVIEKNFTHKEKFLNTETYTYDAFHLKTHTDKEGNLTIFDYDPAGRKIKKTESDHITTYGYDSLGKPLFTNHSGLLLEYTYRDFMGQIIQETKTAPNGKVLSLIEHEYDPDQNRNHTHRYPNNQKATETFEYDGFKRLIKYTDATNHVTTHDYSELENKIIETITDPNQIKTTLIYDSFGRLEAKQISNLYKEKRFYDPAGNLSQTIEGVCKIAYTYTPENQIASITRGYQTPDARITSYTYNSSNLLETKTLPDGKTLTYTYDPYLYLESVTSEDQSINQTFSYSPNGSLKQATTPETTIDRIYDCFGNLKKETINNKVTVTKTYTPLNHLESIVLPDNSVIYYTYDPLHLKTVTHNNYTHTYYDYDLSNNPLQATDTQYTYTPNNFPDTITNTRFSQAITYDPAGRIENISSDGTYTYDDLSQLKTEPKQNYEYDDHFNINQQYFTKFSHNSLDEISSDDFVYIEYDKNGNLKKWKPLYQKSHLYFYNKLNQLIGYKSEHGIVTFTYDALGRRFSKTTSESKEQYLYHGTEELCSLNPDYTIKDLKIPGLYNRPVAIELNQQLFIPSCDYRGSIRALYDPIKQTTQYFNYTAFGLPIHPVQSLFLLPEPNNPFLPWRYSAKRLDPETDLYYFGQRYYFPMYSRWLTPDPAGFADSTNPYQYLFNDPLRYSDPDGCVAVTVPILVWGAKIIVPAIWSSLTTLAYGTTVAAVVYGGFKLAEIINEQGFSGAGDYYSGDLTPCLKHENWTTKSGSVDPSLPADPDDLLKQPGWKETTHPEAAKKGHRTFENEITGEILRHDEGKPSATGHKAYDHYHRPNPNATGRHDEYLDGQGNPTRDQSDPSHIYSPEKIWWL